MLFNLMQHPVEQIFLPHSVEKKEWDRTNNHIDQMKNGKIVETLSDTFPLIKK